METHVFGFRLRADVPEGQRRFPISQSAPPRGSTICDVGDANVPRESVLQAFRHKGMERLAKTSHDLKSVSGLVGMQETSPPAAKIQDDCVNRQHDGLKDIVKKLQQVAASKCQETRKIASALPET
jgi:hypothetical protein